jgi:hypothetical protein
MALSEIALRAGMALKRLPPKRNFPDALQRQLSNSRVSV